MKTIGYLEGTDPVLLSKLVLAGYGTLPLGNGWDNHGKYINHLTANDKVDAVVGYLHKVFPPQGSPEGPSDILFACRTHKIPVYLLVPKESKKDAEACLKTIGQGVEVVDSDEAYKKIIK